MRFAGLSSSGGSTRIFDLLRGPHITLLGFATCWRSMVDACAAAFGEDVRGHVITASADDATNLVDEQGHARAAYGDDALFVVRPDNDVGLVATDNDPAPVIEYLPRITAPVP